MQAYNKHVVCDAHFKTAVGLSNTVVGAAVNANGLISFRLKEWLTTKPIFLQVLDKQKRDYNLQCCDFSDQVGS